VAKGADCKSAGYAFVGSSPTSPTSLRALRALRLGKPVASREGRRAGARRAKAGSVVLGHVGAGMNVLEARKAALVIAGRNASGRIAPGRRSAVKVAEAMAEYIAYLRERAERKGKAASHAKNTDSLARVHILPEFGGWSLAELSASPGGVAAWHKRVTKAGPVTANKAAKTLRACYRRAARLDRSLPPGLPTSAVEYNAEKRSQDALAPADFPKWRAAWAKIEAPTRKAFQMINLLAGCRPGELARLKWPDVLPRQRCFVIRGAKAENDIYVPMSAAIARELDSSLGGALSRSQCLRCRRRRSRVCNHEADEEATEGI